MSRGLSSGDALLAADDEGIRVREYTPPLATPGAMVEVDFTREGCEYNRKYILCHPQTRGLFIGNIRSADGLALHTGNALHS